MDKIFEGEKEKEKEEHDDEAEKLFRIEQARQENIQGGANMKDFATVNDLFSGWVDDDDGF